LLAKFKVMREIHVRIGINFLHYIKGMNTFGQSIAEKPQSIDRFQRDTHKLVAQSTCRADLIVAIIKKGKLTLKKLSVFFRPRFMSLI